MSDSTKQTYMRGAAILAATAIISKIISALYKVPLFSMLDDSTAGYYQVAYNIYMLLIAVSTTGIPVALSRLVSSASAEGNKRLVKRYFAIALPAFAILGLVLMLLVIQFADPLAGGLLSTRTQHRESAFWPRPYFSAVSSRFTEDIRKAIIKCCQPPYLSSLRLSARRSSG